MQNQHRAKLAKIEIKEHLYRSRYLVPNLVTIGNLFCGFLATIYATSDRFEKAAIAILIALILDGLDGRVARRLKATSSFGVEFDSFSDLVSFGIAPAILMYQWGFMPIADEFGVLANFVFAICAASRLARFNISEKSLTAFVGLPTPGAAGMVAALVYARPALETTNWLVGCFSVLMLGLGFLMISNIEFFSIKKTKLGKMPIFNRILIGACLALFWYNIKAGLLIVGSFYVLSGPVGALVRRVRNRSGGSKELRSVSQ